jgi:hypothetical protein
MTRVKFPQFELVGPPCRAPGCKGVLVDHLSGATSGPKDFFRKCATCAAEFDRVPAEEALAWAERVIKRVLTGESPS